MLARNRCFRIAFLLIAASYAVLVSKEVVEAIHNFQDHIAIEAGIGISIRGAANLIGACGWVVIATAFGTRIDWSRLLVGGIVLGSAFAAVFVASVLELIPVLALSSVPDIRGVYRWATVGAILFAVGAAVIVAGLLESRRGSDLAPRLQVGIGFVTLSAAASTVAQLYQHSLDSSRGYVHALPAGRLVVAVGELGLALAGIALTLGVRWPLARREARLAGAAAGAAFASLCFAVGEGLGSAAHEVVGAPQ